MYIYVCVCACVRACVRTAQIILGKYELRRLRIGASGETVWKDVEISDSKREFCNTSAEVSSSMEHRITRRRYWNL